MTSDLPDVTDLSLVDVQALPDSVIGDVLRRILADVDSVEPVAGFQSAI